MQGPLALLRRTPLYWRIFLAVQILAILLIFVSNPHISIVGFLIGAALLLPGFAIAGWLDHPMIPWWFTFASMIPENFCAWWLARLIFNRLRRRPPTTPAPSSDPPPIA
jgi:hypothetical protein